MLTQLSEDNLENAEKILRESCEFVVECFLEVVVGSFVFFNISFPDFELYLGVDPTVVGPEKERGD